MTQTPPMLPQLMDRIFITEAGLETELLFHHGIELPHFSTFPLLESANGRKTLKDYFQSVIDIARRANTGAVLETVTWRASSDWGALLGYTGKQLDAVNHDAVDLFLELRADNPDVPVVISGNLGPRGDGYVTREAMSPDQAASYHRDQIRSLAAAGADLVSVVTLPTSDEAIGIVRAAHETSIPVVVSFTVETDGSLPSGQTLADAICEVDWETDGYAAYFMINCAHPEHFASVLAQEGPWDRLRGIRANASRLSHAELDDATELDSGDKVELALAYKGIQALLPDLAVVGGCCGTDLSHLQSICDAVHGTAATTDDERIGRVA